MWLPWLLNVRYVFAVVAGGGVINDAYLRLEKYQALEQSDQLEAAKQHPEGYEGMFQIDLAQFADSKEFIAYIQDHEATLRCTEAIFVGVIVAMVADVSKLCVVGVRYLRNRLKGTSRNATSSIAKKNEINFFQ